MVKPKSIMMLLYITGCIAVGIFFNNCSDVKVSNLASVSQISSTKPEISVCSFADTKQLQDKLKIAFIIDMSGSNVRNVGAFPATDPSYSRLLAIKDFIGTHTNFKYKIIPFSTDIYTFADCPGLYKDAAAAIQVIDSLIAIQIAETNTAPAIMKETNYTPALSCGKDALMAETAAFGLTPEFEETHYKFFFVTDGQPTDYDNSPNMISLVHNMVLMAANAAEVQVIPVFYGQQNTEKAMSVLRSIGQAGNWKNPPKDDPLLVNNVGALDFDKLLSYTINEQYKILEFNIINLTAVAKQGHLVADSDMDGVVDSEDRYPADRHSNSEFLLDGICKKFGVAFCKRPVGCDPNKINALRFNECDMMSANLKDGLDTDNDNIPDLIEFLVRTNPLVNDAFVDSDNDIVQNIVEIRSGNPVDSPVLLAREETSIWQRNLVKKAETSCPIIQDLWRIEVQQIPTTPVKAYTDPRERLPAPKSAISISHGVDENVVFVYYIQQLVNGDPENPARQMYGKVLKIKHGASEIPRLNPEDFSKIGDLNALPVLFNGAQ